MSTFYCSLKVLVTNCVSLRESSGLDEVIKSNRTRPGVYGQCHYPLFLGLTRRVAIKCQWPCTLSASHGSAVTSICSPLGPQQSLGSTTVSPCCLLLA